MARNEYPSDLSDAEWQSVDPHVPPVQPEGPRGRYSRREILNGIRYVLRTGSPWSRLPDDLPPWEVIYRYFWLWRRQGVWPRIDSEPLPEAYRPLWDRRGRGAASGGGDPANQGPRRRIPVIQSLVALMFVLMGIVACSFFFGSPDEDESEGSAASQSEAAAAPSALGFLLAVSSAALDEDAGRTAITVTATLDGAPLPTDSTIAITVGADGDGASGADYAAGSVGAITIPAGQTSGTTTLHLTPVDDNIHEDEGEAVSVSGTAGDLGTALAEIRIIDNDPASTGFELTANPASLEEGSAQARVSVTAALNGAAFATDRAFAITVGAPGDSATRADYAATGVGDIIIPAGATTGTASFALAPTNDGTHEGIPEKITISGRAPGLGRGSAIVTIVDMDPPSSGLDLSLSPATLDEGAGPTEVSVTAAIDGPAYATDTAVRLKVGAAGDTASADDYTASAAGDIIIAAGATAGTTTFRLTPLDDRIREGIDETITVTGNAAGLGTAAATLKIADNEAAPTGILLEVSPPILLEEAGWTDITVKATLNGPAYPTDKAVTLALGEFGDSAGRGDYARSALGHITIPAGHTSGTASFRLLPLDDYLHEDVIEEVTLSGSLVGLGTGYATIGILDDDAASTEVVLDVSPMFLYEGAGQVELTVEACFNGPAFTSDRVIRLGVGAEGDTAGTDDYTFAGIEDIVIPAGSTSGTVTFQLDLHNDGVYEGGFEKISVSATDVELGTSHATLYILEDDAPTTGIKLYISPSVLDEDAGQTEFKVTAELNGSAFPVDKHLTLTVGVPGDSASTDDYGVVNVQGITIPAGQTSGTTTFQLTPFDDSNAERTIESLTVSVQGEGLGSASARISIRDNEKPVVIQTPPSFRLPVGGGGGGTGSGGIGGSGGGASGSSQSGNTRSDVNSNTPPPPPQSQPVQRSVNPPQQSDTTDPPMLYWPSDPVICDYNPSTKRSVCTVNKKTDGTNDWEDWIDIFGCRYPLPQDGRLEKSEMDYITSRC